MSFGSKRLYVQLPCDDVSVVEGIPIVAGGESPDGVFVVEPTIPAKTQPCNVAWHSSKPTTAEAEVGEPAVEAADVVEPVPDKTEPCKTYHSVKLELRRTLLVEVSELPVLRAQLDLQLKETERRLKEIAEAEAELGDYEGAAEAGDYEAE